MAPKRRESAQTERPRPAGWSAAVVFDALVPLVIGIGIVVFLIVAFVGSSSNYP